MLVPHGHLAARVCSVRATRRAGCCQYQELTPPDFDGFTALAIAQNHCPGTPFIFVTGAVGEEAAIEALKCGATD